MTRLRLSDTAALLPNRFLVGLGPLLFLSGACTHAEAPASSTTTADTSAANGSTGTGTTGAVGASTAGGSTGGSGSSDGAGGATTTATTSMTQTTGMVIDPDPMVETVACAGAFPADDTGGAAHRISVDGSVSWGELPHFWNAFGTGHLGLYLRDDRSWGTILKEHTADGVQNLGMKRIRSHGLFHDDIGIYTEVDGQPVFNFEKSDQIFDFLVQEQGIVPIIELGPMPSALASDPSQTVFDWNMGISPPKDYALWEQLVREFAQHSVDRYGMDVVSEWDWEVWNEPECCSNKFWTGSLDDYYQLYESSVSAVHSVLPQARLGGPVTSQPAELRTLSRAGELFLDHINQNGSHLGFFSYHSWSFVGGSVDGYFGGLDLLDEYGKNDVPIMITEFGPTWEFGLGDEPQEMHQGAAFAVQTFSDISRRCAQEGKRWPVSYSWWVLSDVFEEGMYRETDPFIGCMGLISREGIEKPAYNAYKFLAQMGDQQLALSIDGASGAGGMAARDPNGGIQIIIYNGQNPGAGPGDDHYYDETEAQDIGVTLAGLNPEVAYDVTEYRVDATHGNAYAAWQGMGRPGMADMSDADWQALRDTMESAPMPIGEALCGASFSKTFSLSSPGVLFVTLTPAVAE